MAHVDPPSEDKQFLRAAVFLVIKQDRKTLLHKRKNARHENGRYGLISGGVKYNEGVLQAAAREASEEAGIQINLDDLTVVHVMHRRDNGDQYIQFFVEAKSWEGQPENLEPEHCEELKWITGKVPEDTIDYVRAALDSIERGIVFSSWGF